MFIAKQHEKVVKTKAIEHKYNGYKKLQGAEAKYENFFKYFFGVISPVLEKNVIILNFHDSSISLIKIPPNTSEQEKKQRIYDLLNAKTNQSFFAYSIQSQGKKLLKKKF